LQKKIATVVRALYYNYISVYQQPLRFFVMITCIERLNIIINSLLLLRQTHLHVSIENLARKSEIFT